MSYFTTFDCTLEEFKQGVAEFARAADSGTLTEDQLDNGIKAVNLMFLGLPVDELTLLLAKGYLEFANKRYWAAECVKLHLARPSENPSDE